MQYACDAQKGQTFGKITKKSRTDSTGNRTSDGKVKGGSSRKTTAYSLQNILDKHTFKQRAVAYQEGYRSRSGLPQWMGIFYH